MARQHSDFRIDHGRVRYLHETVRHGSMRAASEALGLAPSSVSRQIALLERELGVAVLESGTRAPRLTEAGRAVLEHYRDVQAGEEVLAGQLRDLAGLRAGTLNVAIGESLLGEPLYACLDEFRRRHPGVRLELTLLDTAENLRRVAADETHFTIVLQPPPQPGLRVQFRFRAPVVAVMAPDHPLARQSRITLAALKECDLALTSMQYRMRQLLHGAEIKSGIALRAAIECNSLELLRQAARRQGAVTILPAFSVAADVKAGRLASVPLAEPLLNDTWVQVLTRAGRRLSPAALFMLQIVGRRLRKAIEGQG